ncbi:MAG: polysaccharide biosynthesis tyrosine autokinase [Faecousia sp.]
MNEEEKRIGLTINPRVLLHNFLTAARHLLWLFLLLSIGTGAVVYVRENRSYSPLYSSSAVFSVRACFVSTTDITSSSAYLDKNAALTLSRTFPYVINSENTQMLLCAELGTSRLPGTVTAYSTADAGLFTMTATSRNAQSAYDLLLATIKIYPQAASSILGDTQIDIINLPLEPSTTPIVQNTALSSAVKYAAVVLALGLLCIFLISLTRKTIHSAEDLRKLVNLKCFGYIPQIKLKKHTNKTNLSITITNPRVGSSFNESIRTLRVKILKALKAKNARVLMVTSTIPNEGKTTVATNLALSLASEGKRVILIDGDLRKQSLKAGIGISQPSDGLVEMLSGTSKNFRLINVPDSTLMLLSGDMTTEQPQPLLDTPRMKQVLDLLREKLDYIIIDTPPAGILSDAATIAKYCDATLYVVRQDLANSAQILNAIESLFSVGTDIIGCVLNQTQAGTTRYGYGTKYGSYGYNNYGYKGYGYKYASYGKRSSHYKEAEELSREIESTAQDE